MTQQLNKSLKEITVGEMSEAFNKIKDKGVLFTSSFIQISKHFLSNFLNVKPFGVDFEILKNAYLENIKFNELVQEEVQGELNKMARNERIDKINKAILSELEFHKYICKTYMDLVKEPKEELLSSFVQATQDIKEIDETLSDIQKQLDTITKNNIAAEIQEKKPILYYYQEHNQKAKDEILAFIKDDINEYALSKSYDNTILSGLFGRVEYNYRWNPKSYKPKYPNDLQNKFGELPILEFKDVYKKYNDNKPAFYIYLQEYIKNEEIVFSISDLLDNHHLLNVRKEIILEAINTFEYGAKIMFANAVPTIIEGILHDICLLVGENENDLLQKGFQYKLDRLQSIFSYELQYEYYAFRFRLFRNKVAHGRLTKSDVDELADLLLLDLYQICKLVSSTKLKLNKKRFIIDELNKTSSQPNYKYVFEYLLLDKIEIPTFYNLDKQICEVEKFIVSSEFWEFLEKEMEAGGETSKHGIYTILKIISSRKPFDKRCTKLFKKAGIKDIDKDLADHYIKYLKMGY